MQMLQLYMEDCDYKVIHINHGLHGKHMSGESDPHQSRTARKAYERCHL